MKDASNTSNQGAHPPYQTLGTHLKYFRERRSESLMEASGAVEIDPEALERIENGEERPSEDILLLLINHFEVQDQEAVHLWESAGYQGDESPLKRQMDGLEKAAVIVLAMDARTIYSDGVNIDAGKNGVVLNFTQAAMNKGQTQVVSRVGMSLDQAESLLNSLQRALLYSRHGSSRRQLPPPSNNQQ